MNLKLEKFKELYLFLPKKYIDENRELIKKFISFEDKSLSILCKDGKLDFNQVPYIILPDKINNEEARYAINWRLLPNMQSVLVKNVTYEKDMFQDIDDEIIKYNNIILPAVARQFNLRHADYYLATEATEEEKREYIITPNFLNRGEKLISGEEIVYAENENIRINPNKYIDFVFLKLRQYLEKINSSPSKSNEIETEFIKQIIFKYFIGLEEIENNNNWGVIQKVGGELEIAPIFDDDFSMFEISDVNTDNMLENFINKNKDKKGVKEFISNILTKFNFDEAIEDSKQTTGVIIDAELDEVYRAKFDERINVLSQLNKRIYKNKER